MRVTSEPTLPLPKKSQGGRSNGYPLLSLIRPMLDYELGDGDWTEIGPMRITFEQLEEAGEREADDE